LSHFKSFYTKPKTENQQLKVDLKIANWNDQWKEKYKKQL